ncbi:hypothetical protein RCIP0009_00199 [Klebsiella phage RCIP0009]
MIPVISVREQVAKPRAVKVGDFLDVSFTCGETRKEKKESFSVILISKDSDGSTVYILHKVGTDRVQGHVMIISVYPGGDKVTARYLRDSVFMAEISKIYINSRSAVDGIVTHVENELVFTEKSHESVKRNVVPGDKLGSPRRDYEVEYITSSGDIIAKAEKGSTVVISRRDKKLIESLNQDLEWIDESEVYAA